MVCNTTGSGDLKQRRSHTHLSGDDTRRQQATVGDTKGQRSMVSATTGSGCQSLKQTWTDRPKVMTCVGFDTACVGIYTGQAQRDLIQPRCIMISTPACYLTL